MNSISQQRLLTLGAVMIALALVLIGQLVRWQVVTHVLFLQRARSVQSQPEEIDPYRGTIFDRGGHVLAMDAYTYEVAGTPQFVGDLDETVSKLEPWLARSRDELREVLSSEASYVVLTRQLAPDMADAVKELDLSGIQLTPHTYRFYPEGLLAGQLLGFVNASGGGFGLEKYHYERLKGEPGQRTAIWGALDMLRDVAPENGSDAYLNLDHLLQYQVEQELARGVRDSGAQKGTVIVMDPRSGSILAWASYPSYDPNDFSRLANTAPRVFVDPAISEQYEPGSTLKILTMAAALDSGLVSSDDTMEDREAVEVGGQVIRNWDGKGHGTVTMTDVLALSLNVCSAQLSTRMGSRTFYDYLARFGLGQKTGVDLSWEVAGRVKQPGDPDWSESELGMNSFGQGVAVTPLQLITAVAAVANEGRQVHPHVVGAWRTGEELEFVQPEIGAEVISAEAARQLTEMLISVVYREALSQQSGDLVPGYQVAGKTGTAQVPIPGGYHPRDTIVSFVGYLPAENPRLIILVKIDRPRTSQWAGDVAMPVFSRIARLACQLLDIPPEDAGRNRLSASRVGEAEAR